MHGCFHMYTPMYVCLCVCFTILKINKLHHKAEKKTLISFKNRYKQIVCDMDFVHHNSTHSGMWTANYRIPTAGGLLVTP